MKKIQKIVLTVFFALSLMMAQNSFAGTTPPDPPGEHGTSGNQAGGSAPIGGGLFILLGLGAAYGGKKLYGYRKSEDEDESLSVGLVSSSGPARTTFSRAGTLEAVMRRTGS